MSGKTVATVELDHPMYQGTYRLVRGTYPSGRISVVVVNESGTECGSLTIDKPSIELAPDELLIDGYNEPPALAQAALATGAFEETGRRGNHRWVNYDIWTLRR
jgi:hypothetical protein